jgi:alkaline phosphatase D
LKIDALIGKLKKALDTTGLPIDLVIVSDHGMARVSGEWITLDQFANLQGFDSAGTLLYGKTEQERARAYDQLKKASSQFMVYRRKNVPPELNYNQNEREGDPVIVATGPFPIRAHATADGTPDRPPELGIHGFDPRKVPEMKSIFIAVGPDIVKGKTVAPFENVNLYPWLEHMLGLAPAKNDGSLNILAGTLRDGGNEPGDDAGK